MNAVAVNEEDSDIALFLDHAGWLSPRLPDPSWLGVLAWVGGRLEPETAKLLRRRLPIETSEQVAAEQAVVRRLSAGISSLQRRVRVVETPERSVDWPRSWADALTHPPSVYHAAETRPQPDLPLLSALSSLAWSWSRLLRSFGWRPEHQTRAEQLEQARRAWRELGPRPYGSSEERKLLRLDRPAALAIRMAQQFWSQRFSHVESQGTLRRMAGWLREDDASNTDTLLELTSVVSIARAATLAPPEDHVGGEPWMLDALTTTSHKYPAMRLRAGDLICRLGKGIPSAPNGDRLQDRIGPVLDGLGLRSTGNQPDIVLAFHRASQPGRFVIALADAKRNKKGDGTDYLRASVEVAMVYLVSYGHGLRASLGAEAQAQFASAMLPGVTLFCRQGAGLYEGKKPLDAEEQVAFWRTAGDQGSRLPVVAAFDLAHFGPRLGDWSAPVLSAWLGCLGRQAIQFLKEA
ncbi:MAG: hypothetical protein MUF64_23500 [Polyangiaceae bacterium]|jgi:hypothetical protein|nr:hypothetical protein [Polyangiaceae bacterium]